MQEFFKLSLAGVLKSYSRAASIKQVSTRKLALQIII